jgi:hypothetical protein
MGAVKDIYYDVETLFIEGATAAEIASQLTIPIEAVYEILKDFGVEPEDFIEPADEVYSPYYGA